MNFKVFNSKKETIITDSKIEKPKTYFDKLLQAAKNNSSFKICLRNVPEDIKKIKIADYDTLLLSVNRDKYMVIFPDSENIDKLKEKLGFTENDWRTFDFSFAEIVSSVFLNINLWQGIIYYENLEDVFKNSSACFSINKLKRICTKAGLSDFDLFPRKIALTKIFFEYLEIKKSEIYNYLHLLIKHEDIFDDFYYYLMNDSFKDDEVNIFGYSASQLAKAPYNYDIFAPFEILIKLREEGKNGKTFKNIEKIRLNSF